MVLSPNISFTKIKNMCEWRKYFVDNFHSEMSLLKTLFCRFPGCSRTYDAPAEGQFNNFCCNRQKCTKGALV